MTNRKQPTAISRMKQDYLRLKRDPVPYITAEPLPSNLLEWHYVVKGPEDTPYQGGYYHGTLLFPREFPFKPPSIYMLTPNGRFKTNTRLCLSISDFHPDTWNPTWSVGTILTGLLSFMLETTPTLGSTESTVYEKQQYAKKSLAFNLKNANFRELFPEICDEINNRLQKQQQQLLKAASNIGGNNTGNNDSKNFNRKNDCNINGDNVINSSGEIYNSEIRYQSRSPTIINDNNNHDMNGKGNLNSNNNQNNNNNNSNNNNNNNNNQNRHQNQINNPNNNLNHLNLNNNNYCNWHSIYSNLIVLISFAIFALIVNYVIKNLNQE